VVFDLSSSIVTGMGTLIGKSLVLKKNNLLQSGAFPLIHFSDTL